jgi:crotonobetainyl-CoA:carnitine CoA-transferase CaiB-like acyl-CoA transferase
VTGPLALVRVLDLSRLVPGAVCSQLLSDLGADVIKIEEPGAGDYMRAVGPPLAGTGGSYQFATLNRNKRSICVNLKSQRGADLVRRLAACSDVLIENYRPGVMNSFGLSYDVLKGSCPALIYCAISGYGQAADTLPAHDINLLAMSGMLSLTGETPQLPPVPLADFETGERAALSICAALHGRQRGAGGAFIDIAMLDGMVSWMMLTIADYLATGREPAGHGQLSGRAPMSGQRAPGYGVYQTLDGRFIAIGAVEDRLWDGLCEAVGLADLATSPAAPSEVERQLSEAISRRALADWMVLFRLRGVPATAVNKVTDILDDPVVRGRRLVRRVHAGSRDPYPVIGWGTGLPGDEARHTAAPRLGADTHAVLREFGVPAEELTALEQEGAIA